jgi:hypothetical protein
LAWLEYKNERGDRWVRKEVAMADVPAKIAGKRKMIKTTTLRGEVKNPGETRRTGER